MALKKFVLVFFVVIWTMPLLGHGQINLNIDPGIDQTKVDFGLWNRVVVPVHDRATKPYPLSELKIILNEELGFSAWCGKIYINSRFFPYDKSDISDPFYRVLTHEYSHSKQCRSVGSLLLEGLAESEKNKTYSLLHDIDPRVTATSDLFIGPTYDNMDLNYGGGGKNYYNNQLLYRSIAAKWDFLINKLPNGNFTYYYQKLQEMPLTNLEEGQKVLDAALNYGKINGVLPSTFFLSSPASFLNGPDGIYLGAWARNMFNNSEWSDVRIPINPTFLSLLIIVRENGLTKPGFTSGNLQWEITDSFGRVMLQQSGIVVTGIGLPDMTTWPEGTYEIRIRGCPFSAENTCNPNSLNAITRFMVYNDDWENKMFIIANGPRFEDLSNNYRPNISLPPGITADWKPGYYVLTPNGQDIYLTKDNYKRTFSGYPQMVTFVEPDRPYLYSITNGASFNTNGATLRTNTVVPGSNAAAFTWGATHTDPESATNLPLTQSLCKGGQGETSVVFISNGHEHKAPVFFCSQRQINFQVPSGIPSGQAQACIILNSARSNCLAVNVAETDPGIFVVDWEKMTGAVVFQDNSIVNSERPAHAGDVLSIYATGLGAVDNPVSDGNPAPNSSLSNTLNTPTIIIDRMEFPVIFSGLAPGFVGLYQINFIMPEGLSSGNHTLTVSTGNVVSNKISLAIN